MAAKKRASDRKRSRPVEKRKIMTNFKQNKLFLGFTIVVITIIVIVAAYFVATSFMGEDNTGYGYNTDNPVAVIDTSMGTIKVELYEDKAPDTCENFINLADDGFYDGLVFHRVIDGFMIQTGGFDTDGNNKESPYGAIELEIDSELRHDDRAVAMARQGQDMTDPAYFNTATSQFYICDGAQHNLDDYYAVFGKVIDGMNIVREISAVETSTKTITGGYQMPNWPTENVVINSITIENR